MGCSQSAGDHAKAGTSVAGAKPSSVAGTSVAGTSMAKAGAKLSSVAGAATSVAGAVAGVKLSENAECPKCGKKVKVPNECERACPACECGTPLDRAAANSSEIVCSLIFAPELVAHNRNKPQNGQSCGADIYFMDQYSRQCEVYLALDGLVAGTCFEIAVPSPEALRKQEALGDKVMFAIDVALFGPGDAMYNAACDKVENAIMPDLPDRITGRIIKWRPPQRQIQLQVPLDGVIPGQTVLQATSPEGITIQATVPVGVMPGGTFSAQY